jgi:molybdopterin-dependent oxidoreductase-like protein protein
MRPRHPCIPKPILTAALFFVPGMYAQEIDLVRTLGARFGFFLCPGGRGQNSSTLGLTMEGKLIIGLLDKSPQVLERSDIAKLPHRTVKVKEGGRKSSIYSGVLLKDLLERAGADFKVERQGANLGSIVLVESVDAPSVLFAMAELDSALTHKQILLADSKDGKVLGAPEGPFRIIVPDEKEPARWAKQVWAIHINQLSEPFQRR